jgi:hypothetical protein
MSTPAEQLFAILDASTPWLSSTAREILRELTRGRGYSYSAERLARAVGLRNRHQLSYQLKREFLPPLETLARWIRVMLWLIEYERSGISICRSALKEERDPAYRYHLVKRLLGIDWTTLKRRGFTWLLLEFLEVCRKKSLEQVSLRTA